MYRVNYECSDHFAYIASAGSIIREVATSFHTTRIVVANVANEAATTVRSVRTTFASQRNAALRSS